MHERKERIREFLARFFRNYEIQDDDDIFAFGFENLLLAQQLAQFVEQQFGVMFDSKDLNLENFRTVAKIEALVERKCKAVAEA